MKTCSSALSSGKIGRASTSSAAQARLRQVFRLVAQIAETLLLVQAKRIIDLGADAGFSKSFAERLPLTFGNANHVLVPDVPPARLCMGKRERAVQARVGEKFGVAVGVRLP